ncbi:MAG: hypothetical protein IPK13_04635 [Deltaproteobacteria bacterium]|nr:hypothetical protein [Deltaproteobacteria bacterium]
MSKRADAPKTVAELRAYLQRGAPFLAQKARRPTGFEVVDRLLGGGFPKGAVTVIAGRAGNGRMSLAAALLAAETRSGRATAWIDGRCTLYPPALALHGVLLNRLLMIRSQRPEAIRAAEQILQSGAFSCIVMSGLDRRLLSSQRARRIQSMSEGTQVSTLMLVEPEQAVRLTHVSLKLSVRRKHHGIAIQVDKDRAAASSGRRALWVENAAAGLSAQHDEDERASTPNAEQH